MPCISFAQVVINVFPAEWKEKSDWDALDQTSKQELVEKLQRLQEIAEGTHKAAADFVEAVADITMKAPVISSELFLNILDMIENQEWSYSSEFGKQAYEELPKARGIWDLMDNTDHKRDWLFKMYLQKQSGYLGEHTRKNLQKTFAPVT